MARDITKIKGSEYEITESRSRVVDKKMLKREIEDLEALLVEKRKQAGIDRLEKEIANKKGLLAEIDKVK